MALTASLGATFLTACSELNDSRSARFRRSTKSANYLTESLQLATDDNGNVAVRFLHGYKTGLSQKTVYRRSG